MELVRRTGEVLRRWTMGDPGRLLFSPSGREIAVGARSGSPGRPFTGELLVLPVGGGPPRVLIVRAGVCQIPAGWTADGSWVLSWQDQDCSASIAADGLALSAVRATGGRTVALGTTLVDFSWVLPVSGATVLVDTGSDRLAADHKVLRSCNVPMGVCRALPLAAGASSLDPALARVSDQLFDVRVPRSTAMNDFLPHGTLWEATVDGGHARELTAAGTNVADPTPARDGSTVTFVRMTSVPSATVDVLTVRTGKVRVIAPVDDPDYYGEFKAPDVLAVWPG